MKIGVTSSLVREISGQGLSLDELGISLVELYLDEVPMIRGNSINWDLVNDLSGLGIEFTLHAPTNVGKYTTVDLGRCSRANIYTMEKVFRIASILNAEKIVIHGGSIENSYHRAYVNTKRQLRELNEMIEDFGIKLLIENMFGQMIGLLPHEFIPLITSNTSICFDTGHAFLTAMKLGINIEEFLLLSPYIDHVHIHDNNASWDEHLPPGKGLLGKRSIRKIISSTKPKTGILEIRNYSSLEEIIESIRTFSKIKTFAR